MADSGPHSGPAPGAGLLAHPPARLPPVPGYGPAGEDGRVQALLDLLAVAR
jgi:hypothetical protein